MSATGFALASVLKPAVAGRHGVVAAQNQAAARAGAAVLEAGGNAVDAAVATGLALGVVEPWMSGLGGGGAMLVWLAREGRGLAVDMGMVAPLALDPADYPLTGRPGGDLFGWPEVLDGRNLEGPLSVATPGWLAGLEAARARLGTLPFRELVQPALALAREGLAVDWYAMLMIASAAPALARSPAARDLFLPGGQPPAPAWTGEPARLALPALVSTLERLAAEGPDSFYRGELARDIARDLAEAGARLGPEDLGRVAPRLLEPLATAYRDATVLAMPGPFAGATLVRALGLLGEAAPGSAAPDAGTYRACAQALRTAQAERLAGACEPGPAASCTSHLCVVDRAGNLVALTQTLLSLFGSKLLLPRTGILLNNGIMWFDPRPGRPNAIAPGARPLANMCPTLALAGDRRVALGASGGRRILPAVLQLLCFLIDHRMDLEAALHTPRIDTAEPGRIVADARLGPGILTALAELAPVHATPPTVYPLAFACPSAVLHEPATGRGQGGAEPSQPWAGAVAAGPARA